MEEIRKLIEKAHVFLRSAGLLIEEGDYDSNLLRRGYFITCYSHNFIPYGSRSYQWKVKRQEALNS